MVLILYTSLVYICTNLSMSRQFRDYAVSVLGGTRNLSLAYLDGVRMGDTSAIADFCVCLYITARYDELSIFLDYEHPEYGPMRRFCAPHIVESIDVDYNTRKREDTI